MSVGRRAASIAAVVLAWASVSCRAPSATDFPNVISPARPSTLASEPVPRNLEEALDTLDRGASGAVILKMRAGDEQVTAEFHAGLGRWIRNNWQLHEDGPLRRDLSSKGLVYADDMSAVILTSWWRRLHRRPLDVEGQVAEFRQFNEATRRSLDRRR
jgi:hypothetical protein